MFQSDGQPVGTLINSDEQGTVGRCDLFQKLGKFGVEPIGFRCIHDERLLDTHIDA